MNPSEPSNAKITLPNVITFFRLVGAPIFFVMLYRGHPWTFYVFVLLVVSDFLDGHIARWQKSTSVWGERWDPIADKLLVLPLLGYFWHIGHASFLPVIAIWVREGIIIYFRGIAHGQNIRTPSLLIGKLKMVCESIALGLFILRVAPWANYVLWLAMTFALVSLVQYAMHWKFIRDYFFEIWLRAYPKLVKVIQLFE